MEEDLDIPHFRAYLPDSLRSQLLEDIAVRRGGVGIVRYSVEEHAQGVEELADELETEDSLLFVRELYVRIQEYLRRILEQRETDRRFIDAETARAAEFNRATRSEPGSVSFRQVIGMKDKHDRVVVGPNGNGSAYEPHGAPVPSVPEHLRRPHITFFAPPSTPKLAMRAMRVLEKQWDDEPEIVGTLVSESNTMPFWGADSEDSTTPLRRNLLVGEKCLKECFHGTLESDGRILDDCPEHLSLPIKRLPGLELPSLTHFVKSSPIPLHIVDFGLHMYHHVLSPAQSCNFYMPKLENEEEAAYLNFLISQAEEMLAMAVGTVRVLVVVENPRCIFRLNEIIDALGPHFLGASLGWHDYLAATARLYKNDPSYFMPRKSDPNIVVSNIRQAHLQLSRVVGGRGGIEIGGMFGIIPNENSHWRDPEMQSILFLLARDVLTQLGRGLTGFWVADPAFMRIGVALSEAVSRSLDDEGSILSELLSNIILDEVKRKDLLNIARREAAASHVEVHTSDYARILLAADLKPPPVRLVHLIEEVRFNVFQSIQYLAAWLSGEACVSLPVTIPGGFQVAALDDLATIERSRWQIWHSIRSGKISMEVFIRIVHEEMRYILHHSSSPYKDKPIRVTWDSTTEKWYPVAARVFTAAVLPCGEPVEFVTQLLLPLTAPRIRESAHPWKELKATCPDYVAYELPRRAKIFALFFRACGCQRFAATMADMPVIDDLVFIESFILNHMSEEEIVEAARFIPRLSDLVPSEERDRVRELEAEYFKRFSFYFLVESPVGVAPDGVVDLISERLSKKKSEELKRTRQSLCTLAVQRLRNAGLLSNCIGQHMKNALQRFTVLGTSVSIFQKGSGVQTICAGTADSRRAIPVSPMTHFQVASLSKTVSVAFSLEVLAARGISLDASVNDLLGDSDVCIRRSAWRIRSADGVDANWADIVTVRHLISHSAGLGMHYVPGIPLTRRGGVPPLEELLMGIHHAELGYPPVRVRTKPGADFSYSGACFMVLEHLMLCITGHTNVETMTRPFLTSAGMDDFSFVYRLPPTKDAVLAYGGADWSESIANDRDHILTKLANTSVRVSAQLEQTDFLKGASKEAILRRIRAAAPDDMPAMHFPAFAAGGWSTTHAMTKFLLHLTDAYASPEGSGPISHNTAVTMLGSGSERLRSTSEFMCRGSSMAAGVFTLQAGGNWIGTHQAANDGFRGFYCIAFRGPNAGSGMTIISNGSHQGVGVNSYVAQEMFRRLNWKGVDCSKFPSLDQCDQLLNDPNISEEQVVNIGYKRMVFDAFRHDRAEVLAPGPPDPLADINLAVGAELISCTDDRFGIAENLVLPTLPRFDPGAFGKQGKIMDSWESRRHNPLPDGDVAVFRLKESSDIRFVMLSTVYHNGNHAHAFRLEGRDAEHTDNWVELIPKSPLQGHAIHRYIVAKELAEIPIDMIRVSSIPDGGITRLGLYADGTLPRDEFNRYNGPQASAGIKVDIPIPPVTKTSHIFTRPDTREIKENWRNLEPGLLVDVACCEYGGLISAVSNQHYGPASAVISPLQPYGMFDGFETARSRTHDSAEWLELTLGKAAQLSIISLDFEHFVNNNPNSVWIEAYDGNSWFVLIDEVFCKPFAGNALHFKIRTPNDMIRISKLRVFCVPCGGFNRIHVYARVTPLLLSAPFMEEFQPGSKL